MEKHMGSELALHVNSEMERSQVTQAENRRKFCPGYQTYTYNSYVCASAVSQGVVKYLTGPGGKINECKKVTFSRYSHNKYLLAFLLYANTVLSTGGLKPLIH